MDRRLFLATSLMALAGSARAAASQTKIALLGQALIEHALPASAWPARNQIAKLLSGFDVCFTNFETVIKGARAGTPTRELATLHSAQPEVIETLKAIHVNVLSTSNNHAFDLGTGGILDTMDAIRAAKVAFAGTGLNATEAARAAMVPTAQGGVALVAFATGKIREGGAATATRAGVNELRRTADGAPHPEDAQRILQSITESKRAAKIVIAYQHNHDWEPDQVQVPGWQKIFARQCIDAGAAVFVGHGVPLLQAIDIYKGTPIFYGLGNFIFQTEKAVGAYGPESWESVIVDCTFEGERCRSAQLVPITLNEIGLGGASDMYSRGAPTPAGTEQSKIILNRLIHLSQPFGTEFNLSPDGASATLRV